MNVFVVKAPTIGRLGEDTKWSIAQPCAQCGRTNRTGSPYHLILPRWDGHMLGKVGSAMFIAETLFVKLRQAGMTLSVGAIKQTNPDAAAVVGAVPRFAVLNVPATAPNRLTRFCPVCNMSFRRESAADIRMTTTPTAISSNNSSSPTTSASTATVNDVNVMLFDTDVPNAALVLSIGGEMLAVSEPVANFLKDLRDVQLQAVPIQRNPLPMNLRKSDAQPRPATDW